MKRLSCLLVLFIVLLSFFIPVMQGTYYPDFTWNKSTSNPLTSGHSKYGFSVLYNDTEGKYFMYYIYNSDVWVKNSSDGKTNWGSGTKVLDQSGDEDAFHVPQVWWDEEDGYYYMIYGTTYSTNNKPGIARSTDRYTWTKKSDTSGNKYSYPGWSRTEAWGIMKDRDSGLYFIWVNNLDISPHSDRSVSLVTTNDVWNFNNWTENSNSLFTGGYFTPCVWKSNNTYYMINVLYNDTDDHESDSILFTCPDPYFNSTNRTNEGMAWTSSPDPAPDDDLQETPWVMTTDIYHDEMLHEDELWIYYGTNTDSPGSYPNPFHACLIEEEWIPVLDDEEYTVFNPVISSINGRVNNSVLYDENTSFVWLRDPNATSYDLMISNVSSFASSFIYLTNITVSGGWCTNSWLNTSESGSPYLYNYWEDSQYCYLYLPDSYNITAKQEHFYKYRSHGVS